MRKQIVMPAHLMNDNEHMQNNSRNLFKDFSSVAQATGTYTGQVQTLSELSSAEDASFLSRLCNRSVQLYSAADHSFAHLVVLARARPLQIMTASAAAAAGMSAGCEAVRCVLQDYVNIMEFLMKHWNIGGMLGLNSEAQKAQDDVQALLTKFRRLTDRQVAKAVSACIQIVEARWTAGCMN